MTIEALYKIPRRHYAFSSYSLLLSYSGQNSLPSVAHRHFFRLSRNLFKKQAPAFLDRKFCHVFLNQMLFHRISNSLKQLNPAHILTSCSFKISFDIIIISVSQSPSPQLDSSLHVFWLEFIFFIYNVSHTFNTPDPYLPSWFHYPRNVYSRLKIITFFLLHIASSLFFIWKVSSVKA